MLDDCATAAYQEIVMVATNRRDETVVESDVAFDVDVVYGGGGSVRVDARVELVEDDVVRYSFDAGGLVLDINAVTVGAVGTVPSVVIDQITVDFGVGSGGP